MNLRLNLQVLALASATLSPGVPLPSVLASAQISGSDLTNEKWKSTWSDEFSGPDSAIDPSRWVVETGGNGWRNHELEAYTNRPQNIFVGDGNLVIRGRRENYTGSDGVSRNYTSARLKTAGKLSQAYGRFEAHVKIPYGQGLWPALWMLGDDIGTADWPASGEIDVMENIGKEPSTVHGTLHGPGYSSNDGITASYNLSNGRRFADDFHVFAVEWDANAIRSMLTMRFARLVPDPIFLRGKNGCSITRFFFCSAMR